MNSHTHTHISRMKRWFSVLVVLAFLGTSVAVGITSIMAERESLTVAPSSWLPYRNADGPSLKLYLLADEFDPVTDTPTVDERFSDLTPRGLFMVQLSDRNYGELRERVVALDGEILDYIPDQAFIVRMDDSRIGNLRSMPSVRYIGVFDPAYKADPWLLSQIPDGPLSADIDDALPVTFYPFDRDEDLDVLLSELELTSAMSATSFVRGGIDAYASPAAISEALRDPRIYWVEREEEFVMLNNDSAYASEQHDIWDNMGLTGSGQTIAIADSGLDTGVDNWAVNDDIHRDFDNRVKKIFVWVGTSAADKHGHGTHVTGTAAGNGARSSGQYKGVAYKATIVFQDIGIDDGSGLGGFSTYNLLKQAYDNGARVHSDSWGTPFSYGGHAYLWSSRDVDSLTWTYRNITVFIAAGNDGHSQPTVSAPSTAKNCLTVGASGPGLSTNSNINTGKQMLASFSSGGPCPDGRIKPDIVTPGDWYIHSCRSSLVSGSGYYTDMGGTSMATPHAAGSGVLVRQYYTDLRAYNNPSSALIKATMINEAQDMTSEAGAPPQNDEGWGRLVMPKTIHPTSPTILDYIDDKTGLGNGGSESHAVGIGDNTVPFKICLVWTDYPSSTSASKNIVNDLDLRVEAPDGTIYKGNDLAASGWSTTGGSYDRTNTVEVVRIQTPQIGLYTINVSGYNVPQPTPTYAIAMTGGISSSYGIVAFDRAYYQPNDNASITVVDMDLTGSGTTNVNVTSDSNPTGFAVTLNENPTGSGVFKGLVPLTNGTASAGQLKVKADDNISVEFYDANPAAEFRYDIAQIKVPPPITWVKHDAFTTLSTGDVLTVTLKGPKSCAASFSMHGLPFAQNITMFDDGNHSDSLEADGIYGGYYTIREEDSGIHWVRGYLSNGFTTPSSRLAYPSVIVNTTMPRHPKGLTVTPLPQGNALHLNWDPSDELDLFNYRVYRTNTSGGPYTYVGNPGLFTTFNDTGLTDGMLYYYVISVRDANLVESGYSLEKNGTPADTLAPWCNITSPLSNSTIGWNASVTLEGDTDAMMAWYEYYIDDDGNGMDDDGNAWVPIGANPSFSSPFIWDTKATSGGPGEGNKVLLRARARDEAFNNGSFSPVITNLTIDNTPPGKPTFFTDLPLITNNVAFTGNGTSTEAGWMRVRIEGVPGMAGQCAVNGTSLDYDISYDLINDGYNNVSAVGYDLLWNGPSLPSDVYSVVLDQHPPVADAGGDTNVSQHSTLTLDGSASYDVCAVEAYRQISNYTWNIMDTGGTVTLYGATVEHTFHTTSSVEVRLDIKDMAGNTANTTIHVNVGDTTPPVADAGGDIFTSEGQLVWMDAGGSTDNDPNFASAGNYTWTFTDTDGIHIIYEKRINHVFSNVGNYPAMVNVSDPSGNWDTDNITVHVLDTQAPTIRTNSFQPSYPLWTTVEFNATGTTDNDPTFPESGNFTWTFDHDGNMITEYGPLMSFLFTLPGMYSVLLNVTDASGNSAVKVIMVTIANDALPPTLSNLYPIPDSMDVDTDTLISCVFSEAMLVMSIDTDTVRLYEGNSTLPVALSLNYKTASHGLEITPTGTLKMETQYRVVISGSVMDLAHNQMGGNVTWSFITLTPPWIEGYAFFNGTEKMDSSRITIESKINVSLRPRFYATFSEPVRFTSDPDDASIYVLDGNGTRVNGWLSYNASSMTITWGPNGSLEYNTTYIIYVTTGVTDLKGLELKEGMDLSFRTAWPPPPPPPPPPVVDHTKDAEKFGWTWIMVVAIIGVVLILIVLITRLALNRTIQKKRAERAMQQFDQEIRKAEAILNDVRDPKEAMGVARKAFDDSKYKLCQKSCFQGQERLNQLMALRNDDTMFNNAYKRAVGGRKGRRGRRRPTPPPKISPTAINQLRYSKKTASPPPPPPAPAKVEEEPDMDDLFDDEPFPDEDEDDIAAAWDSGTDEVKEPELDEELDGWDDEDDELDGWDDEPDSDELDWDSDDDEPDWDSDDDEPDWDSDDDDDEIDWG